LGDDVGVEQIGGVFEGVVFEPEDVEACFVAGDEVVVVIAPTLKLKNERTKFRS
jgi:hypothetical protein